MDILKLNFDGSYGVIRGYDRAIIRNYSGLVDVSDANEAGIYSLLIGCRELNHLSGLYSIVEGDSLLAVVWGSSNKAYPWCIADWVVEIRYLSTYLSFTFQHVVRESNFVADALPKAGAFRTSLVYDV